MLRSRKAQPGSMMRCLMRWSDVNVGAGGTASLIDEDNQFGRSLIDGVLDDILNS